MLISDSQIHLWESVGQQEDVAPARSGGTPTSAHLVRIDRLDSDSTVQLLDAAGVERAILVPPTQEGSDNEAVLLAARRFPNRLGVMGVVDLRIGYEIDLAHWLDQDGMLGIRVNFGGHQRRGWILDDKFAWLWSAVSDYAIPIMVFAPGQTADFAELLQRQPGVRLILDHLNLGPDARRNGLEQSLEPLYRLSEYENLVVKISALPCYVDEPYPFPSLHLHIRRVIDHFGANRCTWGSDVTRLPCPYRDWLVAMAESIGYLSAADQSAIMNDTLSASLDWPSSSG